MLEAVNSVLQTAPLVRGNVEQNSNARSFSANPDKVQEAPKAPFISPFIFVDVNFDKAVLQIRDSDTGDVITQFPSESRLRANSAAQATADSQPQIDISFEAPAPQVSQGGSSSAPVTQESSAPPPPAPQAAPQAAPAAGNTATAQQLSAFKAAAVSSSAGNGGNVSLLA